MTHTIGGLARSVGKLLYAIALVGIFGAGAVVLYPANLGFWQKLVGLPIRGMALIVGGSVALTILLDWLDERLRGSSGSWGEWSLFGRNINFVPMDYALLRVPFLVLLYFNLPVLAWIEEAIFRGDMVIHPTSGAVDALWRSALFGITHIFAGARIQTVPVLTLGGLWFSWQYLQGGLESATLAHMVMNVTGLTLMLIAWVRTGKSPFTQ